MSQMKDSGVEWIGQIPIDWETKKLKYLAKISTGTADTQDQDIEAEFPFYIRSPKPTKIGYYTHDETAILTAGDGDIGNIWHYVHGKFTAHQRVYIIDEFDKSIDSKYLYYYFKEIFKKQPTLFEAKTTVGSLRMSMLTEFIVSFPTLDEQKEIVQYLDEKISELDRIIFNSQKEIADLRSLKSNLISETVTRGINRNVELKQSNIDWIGDVPKHWKVEKIRYIGKLQNGISKDGESFGTGYPFVSYGDVYNNYVLPDNVNGLVESTLSERKFFSVKRGDVFFTRTSETAEEIGLTATCFKDIDNATFAGFLIRFRPNDGVLEPIFSKYYFSSDILRRFFVKEMMIVTRASLGQNLLKNLSVIIPPIDEQLKIGESLDKEVGRINQIANQLKKSFNLSQEIKKSLIYECVTGKKRIES